MWIIWLGGELWLEQSRDVKAMCGRFDSPNFSVGTTSHHGKSSFHRRPFVFRIDFEVAEELFDNDVLCVKRMQIRTRAQTNFRNRAGQFGGVVPSIGHGTSHRINNDVF